MIKLSKRELINSIIQFIIILALIFFMLLVIVPERIIGQPGHKRNEISKLIENSNFNIIGSSYKYIKASDDTLFITYVFNKEDVCINSILEVKDFSRRQYADLMKLFQFQYDPNHRVWIKNKTIGYLLYNWDYQNWYISMYDSEDFLYTR